MIRLIFFSTKRRILFYKLVEIKKSKAFRILKLQKISFEAEFTVEFSKNGWKRQRFSKNITNIKSACRA